MSQWRRSSLLFSCLPVAAFGSTEAAAAAAAAAKAEAKANAKAKANRRPFASPPLQTHHAQQQNQPTTNNNHAIRTHTTERRQHRRSKGTGMDWRCISQAIACDPLRMRNSIGDSKTKAKFHTYDRKECQVLNALKSSKQIKSVKLANEPALLAMWLLTPACENDCAAMQCHGIAAALCATPHAYRFMLSN